MEKVELDSSLPSLQILFYGFISFISVHVNKRWSVSFCFQALYKTRYSFYPWSISYRLAAAILEISYEKHSEPYVKMYVPYIEELMLLEHSGVLVQPRVFAYFF